MSNWRWTSLFVLVQEMLGKRQVVHFHVEVMTPCQLHGQKLQGYVQNQTQKKPFTKCEKDRLPLDEQLEMDFSLSKKPFQAHLSDIGSVFGSARMSFETLDYKKKSQKVS